MKKTQKLYRFIAITFAVVFLSTVVFTGIKPDAAYAATNYSNLSLVEKARIWVMGRAVAKCINAVGFAEGGYTESEMNDGAWLADDSVGGSTEQDVGEWSADNASGKSDDSEAFCHDVAKETLELMGWKGVDALCEMNTLAGKELWKRSDNGGECLRGTGKLDFQEKDGNQNDTQIWNKFFTKWLGVSKVEDALTNGMRFLIYRENFYQECSQDHGKGWGSPVEEWESDDDEGDKVYKLKWNLNREAGNDGGAGKEWYVVSGGNNRDHTVHIDGYKLLFDDDRATCEQLSERINAHANNYLTELKASQAAGTDTDTEGEGGAEDSEPTCDSEGGPGAWILCIVIDVLDKFISILDTQIKSLLYLDRDVYDNDTVSEAWKTMRNLALLILVPMMMFMVIGTALNFGPFDPYTVKKALPRMFIATIFIVLSLPVTQFGVQLSNAVGQGLGNMIVNAAPDSVETLKDIFKDSSGGSQESLGWTAIIAGLGAFAVGGAGALISFGLVAAVGLLIGFCVLILRQVLIILLIVIAPLAILAWIFPGNDKLWGLWKGTFIAMLLMFPIISMLLASGKFVAGILGG